MWINNKDLTEYGGKLLAEYKVSGADLDTDVFQGRKRSSFSVLSVAVGTKKIILPIVFKGTNRADVVKKKSAFDYAALGKSELAMDDGLLYTVVLTSMSDITFIGDEQIRVDYTFEGVQHGEYVKHTGNNVYCDSTLPYTDCILNVEVSNDAATYKVSTVEFKNVIAGEVLTVDGINGRILVNGIPAAERAEWIEFPKLVPGMNLLQCDDELSVEFYPAYI